MRTFDPWRASGRRKRVTCLVTVSVPVEMTAAQARKEVRTLITDQCNWASYDDQVKAVKVAPAKART